MRKISNKYYQSSIYPEYIIDDAIQDYKRIAKIKKKPFEDGFLLTFHTHFQAEAVIGEFGNYLIQLLNQGKI